MESPENLLIVQEETFRPHTHTQKKNTLKKFLLFQEMKLSSLKLKKLRKELAKPENQKCVIFLFTFFFVEGELFKYKCK